MQHNKSAGYRQADCGHIPNSSAAKDNNVTYKEFGNCLIVYSYKMVKQGEIIATQCFPKNKMKKLNGFAKESLNTVLCRDEYLQTRRYTECPNN